MPRSLRCLPTVLLALLAWAPRSVGAQTPGVEQTPPAVQFTGEVGTRAEYIRNENFAERDATVADNHRFRGRIRLRLGGTVALSEAVEAGLRISTGEPTLPTSAWVTPGDFRRLPIQIDRAYLALRPSQALLLRAGTHANPLFTPTELVWGADVQPTGLSEMVRPWGPRLTLAAGQFILREARTSRPDNEQGTYLLAHGLSYSVPASRAAVTIGVAQYLFHNADVIGRSMQMGELDGELRTNRFDPQGRTAPNPRQTGQTIPVDLFSEFNLLNTSLRIELAHVPLSLAADAALNLRARRNPALGKPFENRENRAAGGALRFGRTRDVGDRAIGIGFFYIESDAVLAAFNADDIQQTNVRTVPVDVQVVLPARVRLVWDTYFQQKIDTSLPSNGGVVHPENAPKIRSRISAIATF